MVNANYREAIDSRDRLDRKHYVDNLTKAQLENDADELMGGMFVMEFKDCEMKMTAINKD